MPSHRWMIAVVVASLFVQVERTHAASLEEAREQLRAWQDRIVSIRVRSQRISRPETNASTAEANIKIGRTELDWIWEDSGRFRDHSTTWNDDRIVTQDMRVADLRRYYATSGFLPDGVSARSIAIHENSPERTSMRLRQQPFWAPWDDATRAWLPDRLQNVSSAEVTSDGLLEIDGAEVGMIEGELVRLDPAHGYLPKSVKYRPSNGDSDIVDEYQEVEPGFWFPKRGAILGINWQDWEVLEVQLNTDLPDSPFKPPIGDGTRVVDSSTGNVYWQGGQPPPHIQEAIAKAKAERAQAAGQASANADPEFPVADALMNWTLWLVLFGMLCIAGAVWLRR